MVEGELELPYTDRKTAELAGPVGLHPAPDLDLPVDQIGQREERVAVAD